MLNRKIGAQLFTVRDACRDAAGLDNTLARLSKIGYKLIQVSGIGPISAEEVRDVSAKHDMEIVCTHKSFDDYNERMREVVEYHKTIGCNIAGIGSYWDFCKAKNAGEVIGKINILNKFTRELREEGISFAYHNHAFEFMRIDGKYIMDYIMEYGEFDLILDVYWLAYAAQVPSDFIKRAGKRARVIHFKDLKMKENESVFCEVAEGNLNWKAIIEACDEAGSEYAMVEQDTCGGDPIGSLEISYNNLKKFGFS